MRDLERENKTTDALVGKHRRHGCCRDARSTVRVPVVHRNLRGIGRIAAWAMGGEAGHRIREISCSAGCQKRQREPIFCEPEATSMPIIHYSLRAEKSPPTALQRFSSDVPGRPPLFFPPANTLIQTRPRKTCNRNRTRNA